MIIGFIGFGKVTQNLIKIIDSEDIKFTTSTENRSPKTIESIKESKVKTYDTFIEVALKSDILISANSPANALEIAKKIGKHFKGLYLDLNNISPKTTLEISEHIENLVDGAIIGKIDSQKPLIIVSGQKADELLFLNDYLETIKISDELGDASTLKMLRSTYTKTLSALLIEASELSRKHGLEEEFYEMLTLTEGEEFREKSLSRINNTLNSKKRKKEELQEILDCFNDDELVMVKAALEKLNQ